MSEAWWETVLFSWERSLETTSMNAKVWTSLCRGSRRGRDGREKERQKRREGEVGKMTKWGKMKRGGRKRDKEREGLT